MSGDRVIDERFRIAQERCPYPLDEDRPLPPGIPALDEEWVVADLDLWGGPHWIVPTNRRLIVLGTTGTDLVPWHRVRAAEFSLDGDQGRLVVRLRDGSSLGPWLAPINAAIFAEHLNQMVLGRTPAPRPAPAPAPAAPARPAPSMDRIEALERLARLRASGALTPTEYQTEKRRILGGRD